jgi:two-component system chemotaxis response regulator CheV
MGGGQMPAEKKQEILLESGTNEIEIMEFTIAVKNFGINVAKVVELMKYQEVMPMPNSRSYVEGIFKPREKIMTVINLARYLNLPEKSDNAQDIILVTNFNYVNLSFHVHTVEAIHRISWEDIEKPDPSIYGNENGLATGIARINNRLIAIIDFEKILAEISPNANSTYGRVKSAPGRERSEAPILVAEDSPFLEKLILGALEKASYNNITVCQNGKEAWTKLQDIKLNYEGPIRDAVQCVITDIEMPQMDGHRLTKLIRGDKTLQDLPVIIFSSLIDEKMRKKGEIVGASAQITKPEIDQLVAAVDRYVR